MSQNDIRSFVQGHTISIIEKKVVRSWLLKPAGLQEYLIFPAKFMSVILNYFAINMSLPRFLLFPVCLVFTIWPHIKLG